MGPVECSARCCMRSPTEVVALTLANAERSCLKLDARLGQDRDAWMKLAALAMRDTAPIERATMH